MKPNANGRLPKVAIACPGVGLVQRGFERLFLDVFHLLEDDMDITLFKGGGEPRTREQVLRFAARNGRFSRILPLHKLVGRTAMHTECLTFALALLWRIRGQGYDVVHTIDPPLARALYKLRGVLGLKFRLLYTEGCAMPPGDYPPADHIHQIAQVTHDEALECGVSAERMSMVAAGMYPERFACTRDRQALRREHGIGPDTFVILSVAALNRNHKRTHHLIDEAARVKGNVLVWLDGSLDHGEPDLVDYARRRLGDRCRVTHVPSAQVSELYRMADVMVHCALFEAFGLAIVEGASTGLPMLIHNAPHFQWLVPNPPSWLDMTESGALAQRLQSLVDAPGALAELRCADAVIQQFSWANLKHAYLDLYRRVDALNPRELSPPQPVCEG